MNNSQKRLAIFLPTLHGGGAERVMLNLAQEMAQRAYDVDLVLARVEGPYLVEVPKSVKLVDLRARRVLTSLPALVRYLRRERPAALLSVLHGNIVSLWARRLAGVPTRVVVSERNMLSSEVQHYTSDLRMRLMPKLVRYFYPWADSIVAVSAGVADDLSRATGIWRQCIQVIYNPIVTPQLREKTQAPLEHPWFGDGKPPVILAVGRLTTQKDFGTLIQAFARVRRTHAARLLILGEGEERPGLEAQVKRLKLQRDVRLPGFVINPCPYLIRAGVFVLSSRWEGLPGVLIEALYCGTPLVATDCPSGPREILADGQYGQLVPVGDATALAHAIKIALDGRTPRPTRESWQPFELETVVHQYVSILFGR